MENPFSGDELVMPSMGDDVRIEIRTVPDDQPLAEEGVFTIVDQYGDHHQVESDAGRWVTIVPVL